MQTRTRSSVGFFDCWPFIGLALLACLLLAGNVSNVLASPSDGSPPAHSLRQRLEAALEAARRELQVPGALVFVQSPQTGPLTLNMGTSDLATQAPLETNMHFRIGSITKTFTGTLILQLVEEGKLRLDDTVSKFQPEVPNGAHISIRELLNMTSGIFNYSEDADFGAVLSAELHGENPGKVWDPRQLLAIAFKHSPYFAPGMGYHYSNTNFILLGLIIEQLTGDSVEHQMQQRIFAPLGMTETLLPARTSSAIPAPYPQGYTFQAVNSGVSTPLNATMVNPSWGWTAGSAISTLHDIRIWARALATGTLLTPALQKERLMTVPAGNNGTLTAGYGLALLTLNGFIGHNGALPGYQSFIGYNPQRDETFVVLANMDQTASGVGPADELAKVIIQSLNS